MGSVLAETGLSGVTVVSRGRLGLGVSPGGWTGKLPDALGGGGRVGKFSTRLGRQIQPLHPMKNHSLKTVFATAGLVLFATAPVFGSEAETEFKRMDSDGNGKVTAVEHAAYAETMFKQSDTNYDGQVSVAECNAAQSAHGKKIKKDAAATHVRLVDTDGSGQI